MVSSFAVKRGAYDYFFLSARPWVTDDSRREMTGALERRRWQTDLDMPIDPLPTLPRQLSGYSAQ